MAATDTSDDTSDFPGFFGELLDVCAMLPSARLPPGASEQQMAALEAELGFALPDDLRAALRLCDGLEAPEIAGSGSDAGLLSTAAIAERWRFQRELDGSVDPRLLPIADDNGVLKYLVLIPGSKHFGAVGTWDSDGDAWGDIRANKLIPGFRALLERALVKLRKKIPKGFPVLAGFARGELPGADEIAEILAALKKTVKRAAVGDRLAVFARNQALLTTLVEGLLRAAPQAVAEVDHTQWIAQAARTGDVALILDALVRHPPTSPNYGPKLLAGWDEHLDDLLTTLVVRDAAEVERRSGEFTPALALGYSLVRVRLGLQPPATLSPEIQRRLVRECEPPDHVIWPDGRGGVKRVDRPEEVSPLEFAVGPLFTDADALAREALAFGLADAPHPANDGARGWADRSAALLAPVLRVATPEQLATVLQRIAGLEWRLIDAALPVIGRNRGELLASAARSITGPNRIEDVRAPVVWAAYYLALRDGVPLPDCDDMLQPTIKDRDEPRIDPAKFAEVFVALGPERFERALAGHPVTRWKLLAATPPTFRAAVEAWVADREQRERPPALAPVHTHDEALAVLTEHGPQALPGLLAATSGPLRATLLRHAHRIERGGAAALVTALQEQGEAVTGTTHVVVTRAIDAAPAAVRLAFELGGGDVLALSRAGDGRVLVGRVGVSPVLLDLDARTTRTLGPPGTQAHGLQRALPDGRMAGYQRCELALFDAAGELVETRKTGYQKYPEPTHLQVTPDGRAIVTGTPDGGVRVHPIAGGKSVILKGHTREIYSLQIAGERLVSHDHDDRAIVWDLATNKQLGTFAAQYPGPCTLTPSGARLIAWTGGALVQYDVATGALLHRVELPQPFLGACLDETRCACADFLGDLTIVDVTTGVVGRVHATGRRIFSMLALDDDHLVVGGTAGQVRVVSSRSATLEPARPHTIVGMAVAPDESAVAVWQAPALGNPSGWLLRGSAAWQPTRDAAQLAVGAPASEQRGTIRRTADGWVKYREQTGFIVLRDGPSGTAEFIVTVGPDGCVNFWRASDGALAARVDLDGPVGAIATSDAHVVVALDHGGRVHLDIGNLQ